MKNERWQLVEKLYHAALERDSGARATFLAQACAGDEELRREVEALLKRDRQAGGSIERPAPELEASAVAAAALAEASAPASRSPLPRQIGTYTLLALLGKGGMGEVHLALDARLNRKVAIKLLPTEFTADAERVRRFEQEARATSALNHPNIITIHEIGQTSPEAGSTHFIVTEFIEGQTLRQQMASLQMKLPFLLEVVIQVANALAAAHAAGVVHRDIKPENVMLRPDGYVKVLDFGLAKLTESPLSTVDTEAPTAARVDTETGVVMGTVKYMSPEQARGLKVDARTDIFSLGVVLYEMVAGRAPFAGATTADVIAAILEREPPPLASFTLAAPEALEWIITKALRKDREERYQTIKDLLIDLKDLKQELEFNAKLARSAQPAPPDQAKAARSSEPSEFQTAALAVVETDRADVMRTASSAEYLVGEIKHHKLGAVLALLLLLTVIAGLIYFNPFGGSGQAIESLAVLPFVNVGKNSDTEYLSDGITDSLINSLSQLPRLKVMSRNSVFQFKGSRTDAQRAGHALGVRVVLTGEVTQRGNDLLISAELVDVRDNSHLWGEQYNRKLADLLQVQAELSRDISEKLRLRLSGEDKQRLTKRGTENAEAYDLYLKGHHYLNLLTPEGDKKGLDYFQRAIAIDPHYGQVYAELSEYYVAVVYASTASDLTPKEASQKAKDAALKAMEIDDTLAEAHTALAMIATLQDWDWTVAEREFRRAIALNPNYVNAHHSYSHYFIYLGRFDESLAESQRALALDPLDAAMNFHLGFHYYNARQYDQAIIQLQKALDMNPKYSEPHAGLGVVYEQQRRYHEAIAELQKCMEMEGSDQRGVLGHVYAISGQRGEAQKLLDELREEAKHKYVSSCYIARIYEGLGEKDQAFAWLEKAYAEHDPNIVNLKVDPQFDRLHSDPRFTELLRRIGLPQ